MILAIIRMVSRRSAETLAPASIRCNSERTAASCKDLCIFAASNAMRSILDDVRDEFLKGFKTTDERLEEYTEEKLKAKEGGVNASVQK